MLVVEDLVAGELHLQVRELVFQGLHDLREGDGRRLRGADGGLLLVGGRRGQAIRDRDGFGDLDGVLPGVAVIVWGAVLDDTFAHGAVLAVVLGEVVKDLMGSC